MKRLPEYCGNVLNDLQICDKIKAGATVHRDPNQKVPYAVKGNEWIGYDDEQSLRDKVGSYSLHSRCCVSDWCVVVKDLCVYVCV